MIYINIKEKELLKSKEDMKVFDRIKTYDKFNCNRNYIGLLGEMVLHRYMSNYNIKHNWIPFIKKGTNWPDFYISDISIDLKTSTSGDMWVPKTVPHDIYIGAQIDTQAEVMVIHGWMTKECLMKRKTRVVPKEELIPIEYLIGVYKGDKLC